MDAAPNSASDTGARSLVERLSPFQSHAQNFEDVILHRALKDVSCGTYLDIGAYDPNRDNVSKGFYDLGWRGISVEPVPEVAERFRVARPDDRLIEAVVSDQPGEARFYMRPDTGLSSLLPIASASPSLVKSITLSTLFDQFDTTHIHWMKIDVEGSEAAVLDSWGDHAARPWVICIEAYAPNSQIDVSDNWVHQLTDRGYDFVYDDGLNHFFVHQDHAARVKVFGPGPNINDNFVLSPDSALGGEFAAQLGDAQLKIGNLDHALSVTKAALDQAEATLAAQGQDKDAIRTRLDETDRLRVKVQSDYDDARHALKVTEEALAHHQATLAIREQALTNAESLAAARIAEIEALMQEKDAADHALKVTEEALDHHQATLVLREQALTDAESLAGARETEIEALRQKKAEADHALKVTEDALTHHQATLVLREQALTDAQNLVTALTAEFEALKQEKADADHALTVTEDALAHYQASLAQTETQLEALRAHHARLSDVQYSAHDAALTQLARHYSQDRVAAESEFAKNLIETEQNHAYVLSQQIEEIERRDRHIHAQTQHLDDLKSRNNDLRVAVEDIQKSMSWRLGSPLRVGANLLRFARNYFIMMLAQPGNWRRAIWHHLRLAGRSNGHKLRLILISMWRGNGRFIRPVRNWVRGKPELGARLSAAAESVERPTQDDRDDTQFVLPTSPNSLRAWSRLLAQD